MVEEEAEAQKVLIVKSRGFDSDWLFEAAKQIRINVFVGEQGVPLENEQDAQDAISEHVVMFVSRQLMEDIEQTSELLKHEIIGKFNNFQVLNANACSEDLVKAIESGRLVPVSTARSFQYKHQDGKIIYKVGRVAVIRTLRSRFGAGRLVMQAIEQAVTSAKKQESSDEILIFLLHAQTDKSGFYEKCGYIVEKDPLTGQIVEFEEEQIMHVKMYKYHTPSDVKVGAN